MHIGIEMIHDESVIRSEIDNYLQSSKTSQFLTWQAKRDILFYLVNTDLSGANGRGVKCKDLKNYLVQEKKYPVFDETQSRSICHFLGKGMPKFIGGRNEIGYYFNSKNYGEEERKLICQYLEEIGNDKLPQK